MKAAAPDRIPAVVLFREIKARGYDGGETRVKQFVRGLVPAPTPAPAVRFETEPGHQMQADWASVGRGTDKLRVFIATLGWSRAAYVEFCDDDDSFRFGASSAATKTRKEKAKILTPA